MSLRHQVAHNLVLYRMIHHPVRGATVMLERSNIDSVCYGEAKDDQMGDDEATF